MDEGAEVHDDELKVGIGLGFLTGSSGRTLNLVKRVLSFRFN
jgi:hypothetical protein